MKHLILYLAIIGLISTNLSAQINVTATAGAATGTYPTLKGAFDAINAGTHKGAININVTASTTETASAVLNASILPANYTSVLIKPETGVNATISGSVETIIKLNGSDNVTIDGSNNGTSSQNLTIINNFVPPQGEISRVVWICSTDSNGADNAIVKNTKFAGSISGGTSICISLSGSTGIFAENPNNNFAAINNRCIRAGIGISAFGTFTYSDTGWIIRNNEIGSSNDDEKMLYTGIIVQATRNFEISKNTVEGIESNSTRIAQGLYISAASNGFIFNNNISRIKNLNGGGSAGIYLNTFNSAANILIYNNTVSDVIALGNTSTGANEGNGNGFFVGLGGGYRIYHNTVVMNANQTNAGKPAAFNVGSGVTTIGAIDLRNNILVNNQTQAGEKYSIYSSSPNTVFSNIDYNNYYSTGANIGYIGNEKSDLTALQNGFGGNVNSLNIPPVFMSATDFRLAASFANAALDNKATPIAEVTTDADGVTRSALTPDFGGFEFSAPASAESFSKSAISYNNPVNNFLQLRGQAEISSVEIYNITGQAINTSNINATEGNVDMSALSAGIYVVKVNTLNGSESIKIMKK